MAHPSNQHIQAPQFDQSLDIFHFPHINCDVIMSKYRHLEQLPINNPSFSSLKILIIKGEAQLDRPLALTDTSAREPNNVEKSSSEHIQSGEWVEIDLNTPFTFTFFANSQCIEFWFE